MTEEHVNPRDRRLFRGAAVVGFWTLIGLASAAQAHVMATMEGAPVPVWLSIFRTLPAWWFWIPVTPAIAWLGRRARLEQGSWVRASLVHLGAASVVVVLHALWLAFAFDRLGVTAGMTETPAEFFRLLLLSRSYLDVLTYAAILGAVYAFDYHDRFRERELRASRLETQLVRARVDALRMQLNPHFLFNALNAVAAQVRGGRSGAAVTMLGGLGDLLRYALDSGEEPLVPLWQELAFLERYLEIERVRFADRLEVAVDVPEDARAGRVPPLLLQPLVENAVRHGIAPRDAPGRVEVEGRREGDRLILVVRDDGAGLSRPARGRGRANDRGSGVGLANTRARLAELYGKEHALAIVERPEGGVEVTLRIPWDADGAARADGGAT